MQIDTKKLKAALAIAPKNQLRFYLNGVHYNSELNALEATDAYCAIRIAKAAEGELLNKNLIIPREAAKAAVKQAEQDDIDTISLVLRDGGQAKLGSIIFTPIDGDFPNVDKVMPQEYQDTGAEHPAFNIYLLNKWRKAQEAMDEELIPIWRPMMIKENQALQTLDDMTFVVMATIPYGCVIKP
jgi:DNA polymerase III beta subunit, central domain